jgi:hypothetical protein
MYHIYYTIDIVLSTPLLVFFTNSQRSSTEINTPSRPSSYLVHHSRRDDVGVNFYAVGVLTNSQRSFDPKSTHLCAL